MPIGDGFPPAPCSPCRGSAGTCRGRHFSGSGRSPGRLRRGAPFPRQTKGVHERKRPRNSAPAVLFTADFSRLAGAGREVRTGPALGDPLHGLRAVRPFPVLPGVDRGDRSRPDPGTRPGHPQPRPRLGIVLLHLRPDADPDRDVPRRDRGADRHDGAVHPGGGRGPGVRRRRFYRRAGNREAPDRRRHGLQPDGDPEAAHPLVPAAAVRHPGGPGAFLRDPGEHDGGNPAGAAGAACGLADELCALRRTERPAGAPVLCRGPGPARAPGAREAALGARCGRPARGWRTPPRPAPGAGLLDHLPGDLLPVRHLRRGAGPLGGPLSDDGDRPDPARRGQRAAPDGNRPDHRQPGLRLVFRLAHQDAQGGDHGWAGRYARGAGRPCPPPPRGPARPWYRSSFSPSVSSPAPAR